MTRGIEITPQSLRRFFKAEGNPENLLLPLETCSWRDDDMPLERRGVDGGFVWQLITEVREQRNRAAADLFSQERASTYFDNVPSPSESPWEMQEELNARRFVARHLFGWTAPLRAPLYARVPLECRGRPKMFLSYSWDADLLRNGVIEAIEPYLKDGECIWIDTFCHNQHNIGSVVPQMERVIADIDRLLLPMSEPPWFERSWCIWEVLCAIHANKEIEVVEYAWRPRTMFLTRKFYLEKFESIEKSKTSFAEDKALILQNASTMFGSVAAADEYLRAMMIKFIDPDPVPQDRRGRGD
jgi:hypothetical protein